MASYYFTIIGTKDSPIYELEFSSFKSSNFSSTSTSSWVPGRSQFSPSIREMVPFIANSSLDMIEDLQWSTNQFNLGKIDSFYGLLVSGYVSQGNIKFILCYDNNANSSQLLKLDENSIKQFFIETHDLYTKCLLNPFYNVNDPIISPDFDLKVKLLTKKYL